MQARRVLKHALGTVKHEQWTQAFSCPRKNAGATDVRTENEFLFGNPAIYLELDETLERPEALRPRLAAGLPLVSR